MHVHVPEGGVPKDGPSAGITMGVALTSALTGIPVRSNLAMTGEITLRGRVLPIGGLKEKLIAALRGGIERVLIPKENARDLKEISDRVKRRLEIVLVESMDQVLQHALRARRPDALRHAVGVRALGDLRRRARFRGQLTRIRSAGRRARRPLPRACSPRARLPGSAARSSRSRPSRAHRSPDRSA